MQTLPFLKMRAAAAEEIQRFNAFAMDQHIALPLILGRNHLYNQDRMRTRLADMVKEVSVTTYTHLIIIRATQSPSIYITYPHHADQMCSTKPK
jgi:hypothetical protein